MCNEIETNLKKSINSILRYGCVFRKDCFVIFTAWRNPYVILSPNLMTVQTSKGKAPHTCKESIRGIMASKFQKELLLKLPQNKVASNIVISKKNIIYDRDIYDRFYRRASS